MRKTRTATPLFVAILFLLLLIGLYPASYLCLLRVRMLGSGDGGTVWAEYRIGGNFAKKLYGPAEYVDRAVRPGYWTWPEEKLGIDFEE